MVTAQDISDEDLESLLGDEPVPQTEAPKAEVPTEVTETVEAPATVEAPIESHPSDTVSIDTIDLDSLDDTPVEPLDTVVPVDPPVVESVTVDDDLESLRADLDDEEALKPLEPEVVKTVEPAKPLPKTPENVIDPEIFDVGKEERELLSLAQNIQGESLMMSGMKWPLPPRRAPIQLFLMTGYLKSPNVFSEPVTTIRRFGL